MEELSSPVDNESPLGWVIFIDGASYIKGSGIGIVLEWPSDILNEQALKFEFTAINNQEEYKAFIIGMILTLDMGASRLLEQNWLRFWW